MSETVLNFVTEHMLEKIDILDIKIDDKVTLAKELGKILTKAKDVE